MDKQIKNRQKNRRKSSRKIPRGTVLAECRRGRLWLGVNIATGFLDLSQSGVRILSREPFKLHEEVEIVFQAFGIPAPIKRGATVIWTLPLENGHHAAGMEFEHVIAHEDIVRLSRP
ncbi:MAG: PilZ domain-containing protein [Planctomycetes bacterium]|nr:PilZ domain-containing protein [Planctomycetota bacterium]